MTDNVFGDLISTCTGAEAERPCGGIGQGAPPLSFLTLDSVQYRIRT